MAESRRQAATILVILLLLALLPPGAAWLAAPDLITLGTQIAVTAIAAVSLDLLIGYAGLASFGHAAFFGLGGYVVGIMALDAQSGDRFLGVVPGSNAGLLVFPVAMVVSALVALPIGALSLRTRGVQFIMITLAFAEMLYFLFVSLPQYGGDDGMSIRHRPTLPWLDTRGDVTFYYVCLVALAAVLLFCRMLVRSRFGMALQAIRQNERRMAALGMATTRYRLAIFVIAGGLAGLGGALNASLLRYISPDMLHWTMSGDLMAMVVLGGTASLFGPVLGAALLVGLQSFLAQWTEHWMVVMGPLVVLVVLFARRGIWGFLGGSGGR